MTSFYVEPAVLSGLAGLLERIGNDAREGRRYVQHNTGLSGGEGWLNVLSGAHDTVVSHTTQWLLELYDPATIKLSGTVEQTVERYRSTDTEEAARMDAAAPSYRSQVNTPNLGTDYYVRNAGTAAFGDVAEPAEHYRGIADYNTAEEFRYEPSWADLASVSGLGRSAVIKSTEFLSSIGMLDRSYDPYDLVLKPVVGDWAGFRGTADVMRHLADAIVAMSANLLHAQASLPSCWRGNAADGCSVHIQRLRGALGETYAPLHGIADRYEEAAQGQADFRAAVAQLLGDLIDAAAILVLAIAGGAAFAWTGIGGVIGGLIGIGEAYIVVNCINNIIGWYNRVNAIIQTVQSAMNGFGQLYASDYFLPRLPALDDGDSTLDALPS